LKATKAKSLARIEDILRVRLERAEAWDIRQYATEKAAAGEEPWKLAEGDKPLGERQLRRYVAEADKLIAASCRTYRKKLFNRHLAQRRRLYARALNAADYSTALRCLRDEAELLNLYPRPEDELVKEIEKLKKQLREIENDGDGIAPGGHRPTAAGDPGTGGAIGAPDIPVARGPSGDPRQSGDDAGPVASEAVAVEVASDVAPLFPAKRQEPNGGRARLA